MNIHEAKLDAQLQRTLAALQRHAMLANRTLRLSDIPLAKPRANEEEETHAERAA